MTELRLTAACLQDGGRSLPTGEYLSKDAAEHRREAEHAFREWLNTLPEELILPAEDHTLSLTSAWIDESFERGFVAGMRLMCQVLSAHS